MATGFAPKQKGSAEPPALDASILTHEVKLPFPSTEEILGAYSLSRHLFPQQPCQLQALYRGITSPLLQSA